jgi:deoxycytidylate deaminase
VAALREATGRNRHNGVTSVHAEMDAIAGYRRDKCRDGRNDHDGRNGKWYNLLVVKFKGDGKLGISKPCSNCLESLRNTNIKIRRIYYSDRDGNIIGESFRTITNDHVCIGIKYRGQVASIK